MNSYRFVVDYRALVMCIITHDKAQRIQLACMPCRCVRGTKRQPGGFFAPLHVWLRPTLGFLRRPKFHAVPSPQSNRDPEGRGYFEGEASHETAYPGSQDSLPQPLSAFLHRRPFRRDHRRRPPLMGVPDTTSSHRRSTSVRDHTEG